MMPITRKTSSLFAALIFFLFSTLSFAGKHHPAMHKKSPFDKTNLDAGISLFFPGVAGGPDFSAKFPVYTSPVFKLFLGPSFTVGFSALAAIIDINAKLSPTFEIKVPEGFLGVFIDVPLGVSFLPAYQGGAFYGLNFGIIPGVKYFITPEIGIYTSLGFSLHAGGNQATAFGAAPGGVWNAGVSFAL